MSMSNCLRIGEAAVFIGVCRRTLRRWEQEGRFHPTHRTVGGHRRYKRQALHEFIQSRPNSRKDRNTTTKEQESYYLNLVKQKRRDVKRIAEQCAEISTFYENEDDAHDSCIDHALDRGRLPDRDDMSRLGLRLKKRDDE